MSTISSEVLCYLLYFGKRKKRNPTNAMNNFYIFGMLSVLITTSELSFIMKKKSLFSFLYQAFNLTVA